MAKSKYSVQIRYANFPPSITENCQAIVVGEYNGNEFTQYHYFSPEKANDVLQFILSDEYDNYLSIVLE